MTTSQSHERSMDRKSFSILVREHQPALMVYARALISDEAAAVDLVQESFVAAWKNLEKFDIERDFATWMRGILRNKWRDHCRKIKRRREISDEGLDSLEQELSAWEEQCQKTSNPIFVRLENCLKRLPESLSAAVTAFYYDQLDGDAAALHLEINPATLRKRLQRARRGLRDCLKDS